MDAAPQTRRESDSPPPRAIPNPGQWVFVTAIETGPAALGSEVYVNMVFEDNETGIKYTCRFKAPANHTELAMTSAAGAAQ